MHHRSHLSLSGAAGVLTLAVAGAILAGCSETAPIRSGGIAEFTGPLSHHLGCNAGRKFTGGGRIDPVGVGKVTFGFNVHGDDVCDGSGPPKGHITAVYHENQSLYHSTEITHFSSFTDPEKGECGEFDGTVRAKHVDDGGDWHFHHFFAEVCDKGEPGREDRFTFTIDGDPPQHQNVWAERLTGGNIQAHKN